MRWLARDAYMCVLFFCPRVMSEGRVRILTSRDTGWCQLSVSVVSDTGAYVYY